MTQFQEAEERFNAGIEAKQHQDFAKATEQFLAAIALNPNHSGAYGEAGAISYALGSFDDAVRQLRQSLDLDPNQGNTRLFLALTLGELRQYDAADVEFQKAILDSEHPAVAYSAYGNFLGVLKRPEAEQAFKSALEQDPNCVLALRDYARLLVSRDRDAEGEALFKKALEVDPDSARTHLSYGTFLSHFEDRGKEAVAHLRRSLELDPRLTEAQEVLDDLAGG